MKDGEDEQLQHRRRLPGERGGQGTTIILFIQRKRSHFHNLYSIELHREAAKKGSFLNGSAKGLPLRKKHFFFLFFFEFLKKFLLPLSSRGDGGRP